MSEYEELLSSVSSRLCSINQVHILSHLDDPSNDESSKLSFLKSIADLPLESLSQFLSGALREEEKLQNSHPSDATDPDNVIEPFAGNVISTTSTLPDHRQLLRQAHEAGLDAIAKGQVAALLLAGGQGTRLGYDGPKGMYDIGMPSHKTLFQYMAERIRKLGMIANNNNGDVNSIPFYIMTSPLNHQATVAYFTDHDNFGLDVTFFPQGTLPAMDFHGKIILESPTALSMAPDGNGGIYPAMLKHGVLDDMHKRGIKYIHAFGVDNALVKPADPTFVGYCIQHAADCGNKVLWKCQPTEKVGVLASKGGKPCIVEYSDISKEMSERTGEDGRLVFGAGNICNHFYTIEFLTNVVVPNLGNMYHVARKKIPYYDEAAKATLKPTENNGIKLESFIFDIFPLSKSMAVLDVAREEEFAPVKNPPGCDSDSPDTARRLFSNVAKRWMKEAGAILVGDVDSDLCEVGPLKSFNGEGLEEWSGKEVECPFSIV
ncbi:hypothetical protein ACHAW6_014866 [Cyclotella cf. meneghiniana]